MNEIIAKVRHPAQIRRTESEVRLVAGSAASAKVLANAEDWLKLYVAGPARLLPEDVDGLFSDGADVHGRSRAQHDVRTIS